jgi:radical SAM PhpK family P-methyltransferase
MSEIIDCLLIGHNDIPFGSLEKKIGMLGKKTGLYKDINLDFMYYKGKPFSASELYNILRFDEGLGFDNNGPMGICNIFSAAIAYLGTFLHRKGYTFDYIDSFREQKNLLAEKLQSGNVTAVAISTTFYMSVSPITEIIKFVRQYSQSVKIIVGGPFILQTLRSLNEFQLKVFLRTTGADVYINSSQGEGALTSVVHALKNNQSLNGIENITYRDGKTFVTNPESREENKLENNMVDWSLFSERLHSTVSVRTAISCPYSCAFCNIPIREGKYQTTSVDALKYELDVLHNIGKVKTINFVDDTFNIPTERFKDMLRMMIKNNYGFKWHGYFRSQFADREMIELMAKSGCEGVFLGVESGNTEILNNMHKFSDVDKYQRVINMLREYEIASYVSLIVGFPGETRKTAQDTMNFIRECKPDFMNANVMYVDKYSPIWNEREKYKLVGDGYEWSHETMDFNTASEILEEMFLSINESIWIPEYNFEFPGIFELKNRGLGLDGVKSYLKLFNEGIRYKLNNPTETDVDDKIITAMKELLSDN